MGRRKASFKSFNTASRNLNCPEFVKPHLDQFENFVNIYVPSENQKYKINSFSICLSNICDCSNVDAAYLHFKESSTECLFWMESKQDENEKQVTSSNGILLNCFVNSNSIHTVVIFPSIKASFKVSTKKRYGFVNF
ncbi:hypothetical protein TNCT_179111 [Trichonephila clavata]|uniref:Uncharacterized protein n=1 Tax=Trichonephila clavata TaxID=2740835 RepID=A0A8X6LHS5_TRICU|nr:hypothetical protein TNCT_179111 [Trichonephila clavata]